MDFGVKMWRFKPYLSNFDVFLERFLASARKKMDFGVKMWSFKPYFYVFFRRFYKKLILAKILETP